MPNDSGSNTENAVEQENDKYLQITLTDITDELANGIDSAKAKYLDKKVVFVSNFDKMNFDKKPQVEGISEDSIILTDTDEEKGASLYVIGLMKTDKHRERYKQFSENEMVVIRGTVTDISESAVFIDIDDMD